MMKLKRGQAAIVAADLAFPAISLRGTTRSIDKLRAEAAKCALLCANCHAAVEVGRIKL